MGKKSTFSRQINVFAIKEVTKYVVVFKEMLVVSKSGF